MASTMVKSVKLRIIGDDGDTETKLDSIGRKADELAKKHPELKVKIDSAAATAKLGVLRAELKKTDDAADETGNTFRSAFARSALSLSGFGDAATLTSGEATMAQKAMAGLSLATGLLEPLAAGAAVAVGAVGAAAVTMGVGIGIFGKVASAVYTKASTAVTAYTAAQKAAASATTSAAKTTALAQEKAAFDGLTTSQKNLAHGMIGVQHEWTRFVNQASPGVTATISQGMMLIPRALALAKPFLFPIEQALNGIINKLQSAAFSKGLSSFTKMLAGHAGGDLTSLAGIIGHIAVGLGGIIKAFIPVSSTVLGGLDKMTAGFAKWGQTLSGHSGFQSMMAEAKQYAPQIAESLKNIGAAAVHLVGDMAGTRSLVPVFAQLLPPITAFLDKLVQANPALVQFALYTLAGKDGVQKLASSVGSAVTGVQGLVGGIKGGMSALTDLKSGFSNSAAAASAATGIWGTVGGKLSGLGGMVTSMATKMGLLRTATEAETVAEGEMDVAMEANPIGLIVVAIGALVAAFVLLWTHSAKFRDFWIGTWKVVKTAFMDAFNFVKDHWKLILGILTGPVGAAVIFVVSHWKQISAATASMIHSVVGFFENLASGTKRIITRVVDFYVAMPGRILRLLASLPGKMLSVGKNIVMGLVHGIESMFSAVTGAISHLAGLIPSGIGKVLSMFSPSRVTYAQGVNVVAGLAGGMMSGIPIIRHIAGQLGAAAGSIFTAGQARAATHQPDMNYYRQAKFLLQESGDRHPTVKAIDRLRMELLKQITDRYRKKDAQHEGTPGGVRGGTNFYRQAKFLLQERGDKHPTVKAIDRLRAEIIKDHQKQADKHLLNDQPVIKGHTGALKDHTKALNHLLNDQPVIKGHTGALKDHTRALEKAIPALIRIGNHDKVQVHDVFNINVKDSLDGDKTAKKIQQMLLLLKQHNGGAALGLG